jgi:8-oxo-dGTP pyrophosphatase MutT (NUDIX family)
MTADQIGPADVGGGGAGEPDPLRAAATVVVARPCRRGGVEVLVLRRTARHRFLPGYVVFPGGAVDPADADLATALFADPSELTRACAVRELLEEAGVALTRDGVVAVGDESSGHEAIGALPPATEQMPLISRWIAPEDVPVRFDASFFAVAAPEGVEPRPDGKEAERVWWARPVDLLEANASGGCSLYWPTMKVLEGLGSCTGPGEVLASRLPQVEPDVEIV